MAIVDTMKFVIIGAFALLVLVNVLGSLDSDLDSELTNTAVHPNGPLVLTIIALFGVAFAIKILLGIFEDQSGENRPPPLNLASRREF